MSPLKFKELIPELSRRLQQSPELVTAVLQVYFKELRTALTQLSHPRVQVLNLGTFQLKGKIAEKKLLGKTTLLEQREAEPSKRPAFQEDLLQEVARIARVLSMLDAEKERKQLLRQNRMTGYEQET